MIAKGFKSVGWVAAVAGAALGCYMLSLEVASERAELSSLERRIIAARQDIRSLQTELGTRGRLQQLEQWNAEVLALSAPASGQFLDSAVTLARFDVRQPTLEERTRVRLASAERAEQNEVVAPAPQLASISTTAEERPAETQPPLIRRASLIVMEPVGASEPRAEAPSRRPARLVDESAISELAAAERQGDRQESEGD